MPLQEACQAPETWETAKFCDAVLSEVTVSLNRDEVFRNMSSTKGFQFSTNRVDHRNLKAKFTKD